MLYCPNPICQTPNPETHRFCQKCRTPLIRRYLWAVGSLASAYQAGDVLGDRFLCKESRIFLDSKPGLPPLNGVELPEDLLPYLRLSAYPLHLPQIYDWLQFESNPPPYTLDNTLLLLDQVPIYRPDSFAEQGLPIDLPPSNQEVLVSPGLTQMWQSATAFRQLHWLWQIAQLWQPLSQERCASTLLNPDCLRVEGGLLRLLELQPDQATPPTMAQLGQIWLGWSGTARSEIQNFLQVLAHELAAGALHNAEQVVEQLDWAIAQIAQAQTCLVQLATCTDRGPTRQRNEDACYPPAGIEQSDTALPLVIVCDGIGGHQGGDVASHLAIEAVAQRILALQPETLDSSSLTIELEKAACLANDLISQRNDSEQRFDRQRMGTTIVMALIRNHELYVVHVGDSRAYRITPWGCYQITVDDDIASREVRLGYSTYRQALQQPSAGALVQALGMVGSSMLYPTVQRFLLDEDSVFLLCSDGLCDNDRVEEVWDTEILPILAEKSNLLTVSRRLIDVGNMRNGYDNVTVGLLSCRVTRKQPVPVLPGKLCDRTSVNAAINASTPAAATLSGTPTQVAAPVQLFPSPPTSSDSETAPIAKTRIIPRKPQRPRVLPWVFGIAAISGLAVGVYPLLREALGTRQTALNSDPLPSATVPATPTVLAVPTELTANTLLRIRPASDSSPGFTPNAAPTEPIAVEPLILQARPAQPPVPLPIPSSVPVPPNLIVPPENAIGSIPPGSILEVLNKQGATAQNQWVKLRVCSVPIVEPPASPAASAPASSLPDPAADEATAVSPAPASISTAATVQPGQEGWLREADLLPIVALDVPRDRASCPPPQSSP